MAPLPPLSPSYRPGQFLPRCSHCQDKGVPDCLRSHCLSARFPEGFFFFKKHSKESTNSVSARSTFGLRKFIFSDRYANLFSSQLFTISFAKLLHTPISLLCIARQLWRECWEGKGGESEQSVGLAAEIRPGETQPSRAEPGSNTPKSATRSTGQAAGWGEAGRTRHVS